LATDSAAQLSLSEYAELVIAADLAPSSPAIDKDNDDDYTIAEMRDIPLDSLKPTERKLDRRSWMRFLYLSSTLAPIAG